jgi:glycosyltransferase involved in cell wall biosynthesis
MSKRISIVVLGLRGFPRVQGGVETHAEFLYSELAGMDCDIEILVRDHYQPRDNPPIWRSIRFTRLWAPRGKGLEAIVHTFLGVLYAAIRRPDVLHIHAIGPALLTPLARILGLKVVVTHHGPDYERQKWGAAARMVLRLGERMGMRFASQRIAISKGVCSLVSAKYARDSSTIPNGVSTPDIPSTTAALAPFGLVPGKYVLLVSRLVPEKRHLDLIRAFAEARLPGWKLALVGAADHPDHYMQSVLDAAAAVPDVVATGFQSGLALRELYAHAGMFVLPSSHEGLPIALLEALSYGLPSIASDIPPNREVCNSGVDFYPLGDIGKLTQQLREHAAAGRNEHQASTVRMQMTDTYRWNAIARETRHVYERAVGPVAEQAPQMVRGGGSVGVASTAQRKLDG